MKFKLLAGQHIQRDPDWAPGPDDPPGARAPSRKYEAGEEVESDIDLAAKLGAKKFLRLDDSPRHARAAAPAAPKPPAHEDADVDALEDLTVAELKDMAAKDGIDLPAHAHKADIVKTIRKAKK